MANENKSYKGAVEPAESAPSGNEMQSYKGAVEPTEPAGGTTQQIMHYRRQQD